MKTISIVSQKGGAGKTSSVLAIGQALEKERLRVLYLDMDYQCSLTDMLGGQEASKKTIYDILDADRVKLHDGLIERGQGAYIAGSQMMAHLDITLKNARDKERRLQKPLKELCDDYDAALIDTPPALSLAQIMSIYASDIVIIPTQADRQHYQQLKSLLYTIKKAQEAGCVFTVYYIVTRYNPRVKINQAFYDAIKELMDAEGIEQLGIISESSVIREAQGTDANLFIDYPKSKPAQEYSAVSKKIAAGIDTKKKKK